MSVPATEFFNLLKSRRVVRRFRTIISGRSHRQAGGPVVAGTAIFTSSSSRAIPSGSAS